MRCSISRIAGMLGLLGGVDRVHIGRVGGERQPGAIAPRRRYGVAEELVDAVGAFKGDDTLDGINPFARFRVVMLAQGVLPCKPAGTRHVRTFLEHGNGVGKAHSRSFPRRQSNFDMTVRTMEPLPEGPAGFMAALSRTPAAWQQDRARKPRNVRSFLAR